MAKRKRHATPFNLSFLDIMACGFGAVTLLFLILKHDPTSSTIADPALNAEVDLLEDDIRQGEEDKVRLLNSLARIEEQIVEAQGRSRRVVEELDEKKAELSVQASPENEIATLRKQVEELEKETSSLREQSRDQDVTAFVGEGDRQYLTGLKLGGRRVLILLDASASMLAEDIVNVIRRRNMSDGVKRQSPKWIRATRTAEWLMAQLPQGTRFQLYTFNTRATPVKEGTGGEWQNNADSIVVGNLRDALYRVTPGGGTSLINAFAALGEFDQAPDNVFLITDGLPTQGRSTPDKSVIDRREREKLFNEAVKILPRVPINVILFPMEGDPSAAALFWQLGLASGGAFISPSTDWP